MTLFDTVRTAIRNVIGPAPLHREIEANKTADRITAAAKEYGRSVDVLAQLVNDMKGGRRVDSPEGRDKLR